MTNSFQLTLDPTVAPARILSRHAHDERRDRLHQSRTSDTLRLEREFHHGLLGELSSLFFTEPNIYRQHVGIV
jgi:hypothetical protein